MSEISHKTDSSFH